NFKIKDIGLESETVFLENANIQDYCWSADSSTLYFLRDAPNAEQSGYPMLLCSYAPKTGEIPEIQEIAKLKAEEIHALKNPEQLLLTDTYINEKSILYATYILELE
ncbi:MAG: hypothetical protein Q8O09_01645, partial [Bacillota bacterium]|nr:hypothetical protein [Bacillota bacterium]